MDQDLKSRTILIAGAGFVSRPVGDILVRHGAKVIFGCRRIDTAQRLAQQVGAGASAITLDVSKKDELDEAVAGCDLVVSLVPPPDHPFVIEAAIAHKKPALTTSYISPAMKELEAKAKAAGILVLNEIGLDPGIDHLWAVKCLQEIVDSGGKCTGFSSYCGGLPAPEASDCPGGFKFSWSPAGALSILNRVARYTTDGQELHLSGVDLMLSTRRFDTPYRGFAFECFGNGDSLPYRTRYPGLTDATTIIRGSLRYEGFADYSRCLIEIGFLSQQSKDFLRTPIPWAAATARILGATSTAEIDLTTALLSKTSFSSPEKKDEVLRNLRELGIFSNLAITPQTDSSPFSTVCTLMQQRNAYHPGERDMVFLQHTFHVTKADGSNSVRRAVLVDYGDPDEGGYSSMAKLVGTAAAVGCVAILTGRISETGIIAPIREEIAAPLRRSLQDEYGIAMVESETLL
ncbi:hypothetical protein MMC14_010004 [Varicellaria rhodocarpa]|nr:hypothetical protein [Varicellaria rhodocarpa]